MSGVKPALYTVKDAMTRSSLSAWELRRLCEAGVLERRYVGSGKHYYRITAASLERYIEGLPSEPVSN